MEFPFIRTIDDIRPHVEGKREIRWATHENGVTIGCYMFQDGDTFNSPHALECRGIAFDRDGNICSRPLHKFFNVGERGFDLDALTVRAKEEGGYIMPKLDGSMIATAWVDGELQLRSKKSFDSDVVRLAWQFLRQEENKRILEYCWSVAETGFTAIFEFTSPEARIVVAQDKPMLTLLHIRNNATGEYLPNIGLLDLPVVVDGPAHSASNIRLIHSLDKMVDAEGYVIQFRNGDMVKLKCPWYLRLHRSITFLRERDIAAAALEETLDDTKSMLAETGVSLEGVLRIETMLRDRLVALCDEVDAIVPDKALSRKDFAIKYKGHPLFGLMMQRYLGNEPDVKTWYAKNRLREDFSLRSLADDTRADSI